MHVYTDWFKVGYFGIVFMCLCLYLNTCFLNILMRQTPKPACLRHDALEDTHLVIVKHNNEKYIILL